MLYLVLLILVSSQFNSFSFKFLIFMINNRPSIARAVVKTPLSLIHSFTNLFLQIFNKPSFPNPKSYEAGILTESSLPLTCHMSRVTCHGSCVTCPMSCFTYHKVVKLVSGGSVINRAYPIQFFLESCQVSVHGILFNLQANV